MTDYKYLPKLTREYELRYDVRTIVIPFRLVVKDPHPRHAEGARKFREYYVFDPDSMIKPDGEVWSSFLEKGTELEFVLGGSGSFPITGLLISMQCNG